MKNMTLLILIGLLFSCGNSKESKSSNSFTSLSSQFIDDPVEGLNYSGNFGSKGVTQQDGVLNCQKGEFLTFKLGTNLEIGKAVCGEKIFLNNLSTSNNAAKIGSVLQSIGLNSGNIIIPESLRERSLPILDFSSADDTAITSYLNNTEFSDIAISQVSISSAQTNIDASISSYLNLPIALTNTLETLTDSRTTSYNPSMDPNSPTYSEKDSNITVIQSCAGLAADSITFSLGFYKSSGLYYAEIYQPAENDNGDIYTHQAFGSSLISSKTFGIGGETTCKDENDNNISCNISITGNIIESSQRLTGTVFFEIPSQSIRCKGQINHTLNL